MIRTLAFCLLLLPLPAAARTGAVHPDVPKQIDAKARYVVFLHGKIVEDKGPRPRHERFGVYEYRQILDALAAEGFQVISEARPQGTDIERYAAKVASQVQTLLRAGVPPERVSVVGFSKGGGIAIMVSSRLRNDRVNFVFLAACGGWIFEQTQVRPSGRVLSIYEASDRGGVSCKPLLDRGGPGMRKKEIRIETGKEHGAFFQPRPVWLRPLAEWLRGAG
ncbi:MAG TPA: alpha/beta hydrolase [Thermoanaerobaculia bacterium]|nr:alpha/beta hydrolase [Thermoanaerobaculia bacterium]